MNTGGARQLCYIPFGWYRFGCRILLPIMNSTEKSQLLPTGYKTLEGNKTDYI